MDRRDFLKTTGMAFVLGTLGAMTAKFSFAATDNIDAEGKITRRRYKDTALTMPLLGYGTMRLPVVSGGSAGDVGFKNWWIARWRQG